MGPKFIILLLFGVVRNALRPVVLNAIYSLDQELIPTFGFYYGLQSLQMIRVEFDFAMQQIVMFEDIDFTMEGVDCVPEFGCEMSDLVEYIADPKVGKMVPTTVARFPLKFPCTTDAEGDQRYGLRFNLYRGRKMKVRNVIGLHARSPFWEYVSRRYGKSCYTLKLTVDCKSREVDRLLEFPEDIHTQITVFDEFEASDQIYRETITDELAFSSIQVSFGLISQLSKQPVFSINQPYLFRINEREYLQFVGQLKEQICVDPKACETENDMFGNLSGKGRLSFLFSTTDEPLKTSSKIDFFVRDMIFIGEDKRIRYNFASFTEYSTANNVNSVIELGLLFLTRCNLQLMVSRTGQMTLAVSERTRRVEPRVHRVYLAVAALLSVAITAALVCSLESSKHSLNSSTSYSLL